MSKKNKIRTRKELLKKYNDEFSGIPIDDPVERIMYCIGDKLTPKKVQKIIDKKNEILSKQSFSCFKVTLYEEPIGSHRPRVRSMGSHNSIYVPNAKDNKKYIESLITDIKSEINIIHTPIYMDCKFYHKMPSNIPVEEQVLFEAGILNPVTKPDIDNVFKGHCSDNLLEQIILDDDLIYKTKIEKFFSFLPRIEISIYFSDQFASKYIYNKIKSRESYYRLKKYIDLAVLL